MVRLSDCWGGPTPTRSAGKGDDDRDEFCGIKYARAGIKQKARACWQILGSLEHKFGDTNFFYSSQAFLIVLPTYIPGNDQS